MATLFTVCGTAFEVDDEDLLMLNRFTFHLAGKYINAYKPSTSYGKKNYQKIKLHNLLLKIPARKLVDHRDTNTLNYRKSNLRIATHSQNQGNVKSYGIWPKGVSYKNYKLKPFTVCIRMNGKTKYLGSFKFLKEACQAYNTAAIKIFGEFARLSSPYDTEAGRKWMLENEK